MPDFDVTSEGAKLLSVPGHKELGPADICKPVIVLIHGFNANTKRLISFGSLLRRRGFCPLSFDYDSHQGVDDAARVLDERLIHLMCPLTKFGFAIVAHSMGGLVARYLARNGHPTLRKCLRGMVFLGTPHKCTLRGKASDRLIRARFLDIWDLEVKFNPRARSPRCAATLQLTGNDEDGLVDKLNKEEEQVPGTVPLLSISGGLPWLELTKRRNILFRRAINRAIQHSLNDRPNDGLVCESSSDITRVCTPSGDIAHRNNYAEFDRINHTNLPLNQGVREITTEFLQALRF